MKAILVLTDFSSEANYVAEFAISLAITIQANLTFCHVLEKDDQQNDERHTSDRYKTGYKDVFDLSDQLESFKKIAKAHKGNSEFMPAIDCIVEFGIFAETAAKIVAQQAINFVIIGSRKSHSVTKFQFGSQTYTLPDKFKCPVLLIPQGSKFEGLKTILYASDLPVNNKKALQFLADLAKPFQATVKVGHIAKKSQPIPVSQTITSDSLNHQLGRYYAKLVYQTLKDDDLGAGLQRMIGKEKINILALAHRKYHFREGVFHSSVSKLMSGAEIPLLILPNSFISEEPGMVRAKVEN